MESGPFLVGAQWGVSCEGSQSYDAGLLMFWVEAVSVVNVLALSHYPLQCLYWELYLFPEGGDSNRTLVLFLFHKSELKPSQESYQFFLSKQQDSISQELRESGPFNQYLLID